MGSFDFGYRKTAKNRKRRQPGVELIVDNFAGGGGASLGIEQATGRAVDISVNHCPAAVAMHEFNHPATRHYLENVWKIDPLLVCGANKVGLAWFSPDCRHFSRAKGAKPVSRKIRCLAWVVVRWARKKKPRIIMLENVREFQDWGPLIHHTDAKGHLLYDDAGKPIMVPDPERKGESFKRWVRELKYLGYKVEFKVLNAADYGAPTHRRRLFIIARCDDKQIVWPKPTHGPGRKKPYRTAAECIDWSIPCPSIFDRKKPLADKTLRRIALGIKRYVLDNPKPFIVRLGQTGGNGSYTNSVDDPLTTVTSKAEHCLVNPSIVKVNHGGEHFRGEGIDKPLSTVTGAYGHAVVQPSIVQVGYGERKGQAPRTMNIEEPLGTVVGSGKHALVSALLTKHYGGVVGTKLDQPAGTITSIDHHAVTTATLIGAGGAVYSAKPKPVDEPKSTVLPNDRSALAAAHLVKMYGTGTANPVDAPLGTVTSGGLKFGLVHAFLCKYFGTAIGQEVDAPLHTVTGKARFSVVTVVIDGVTYAIADIGMRMLQPRELARAQGFPDDFILTGSKSNQVARIGNSVCPPIAAALVKANWRK